MRIKLPFIIYYKYSAYKSGQNTSCIGRFSGNIFKSLLHHIHISPTKYELFKSLNVPSHKKKFSLSVSFNKVVEETPTRVFLQNYFGYFSSKYFNSRSGKY